jgi:MYXO-CTERM domain-containing protein
VRALLAVFVLSTLASTAHAQCPEGTTPAWHGECLPALCSTRADCVPEMYDEFCGETTGLDRAFCGDSIACAPAELCINRMDPQYSGPGASIVAVDECLPGDHSCACGPTLVCRRSNLRVLQVHTPEMGAAVIGLLVVGVVLALRRRRA